MSLPKDGEGASVYISDVLGKVHKLFITLYGIASCRVFPLDQHLQHSIAIES